jgi:hypothetical protein
MTYFAVGFMKRKKRTYSVLQLASAVTMILALLWLTISLPFVYESQQQVNSSCVIGGTEEESGNTCGNNTEEKKPSGNSVSEEYLHNHEVDDHFMSPIIQFHKSVNADVYTAFHGEVHVPPPNVS